MSKIVQNVFLRNCNKQVLEAQYAVRGKALITAVELEHRLGQPDHGLPYDSIVYCNIGNPQSLGQIPITFHRNVMSCLATPSLIDDAEDLFLPDVLERAKVLLSGVPGNTGAYSHSKGLEHVRKNVVKFIEERDGVSWDFERPEENIFLTDGASPGVQMLINLMTRNETDAIMIPIPQYPLYSASIALYGGSLVGYYLDEEDGWKLSVEELERALDEAQNVDGLNVRSMVVINPGNPTGQLMDKENMKEVIDFCARNGLVLLADEVYQENIYNEGAEWHSFRKVAHEMGEDYFTKLEFASFHSVSKGFLGECGRRGGYVELSQAWDSDVLDELYKVASISLCPNVDGQLMVDLMVGPPAEGDPSFDQYIAERDAILASLARRAKSLVSTLNELEGVTSNPSDAAMYSFPQITIPKKAVEAAKTYEDPITGEVESIPPDMFYCLRLLIEQGVCVVPGSGFRQRDGTYHFRTTFLPQEEDMESVYDRLRTFHEGFMDKYRD